MNIDQAIKHYKDLHLQLKDTPCRNRDDFVKRMKIHHEIISFTPVYQKALEYQLKLDFVHKMLNREFPT